MADKPALAVDARCAFYRRSALALPAPRKRKPPPVARRGFWSAL